MYVLLFSMLRKPGHECLNNSAVFPSPTDRTVVQLLTSEGEDGERMNQWTRRRDQRQIFRSTRNWCSFGANSWSGWWRLALVGKCEWSEGRERETVQWKRSQPSGRPTSRPVKITHPHVCVGILAQEDASPPTPQKIFRTLHWVLQLGSGWENAGIKPRQ